MKLITASAKIIDKIDIDQLLVSQAKEQKIIWEMVMKRYEELGRTKKLGKHPYTSKIGSNEKSAGAKSAR